MLAQQLLNGVISGSVYALFALGFTLVFSVHRVLNLAHGAVFMVGAFVGYYAVLSGLPIWLASAIAAAFAGVASVLVQFVAVQPLRRHPHHIVEFAALVTTLGADLVFVSTMQRMSDAQTVRFPCGTFPVVFLDFFGLRVSLLQLVIVVTVAALLAFLIARRPLAARSAPLLPIPGRRRFWASTRPPFMSRRSSSLVSWPVSRAS